MTREVREKLEKVRKYIDDKGLEGVLLNKTMNFAWITGGIDAHGPEITENAVDSILITKDKWYLVGPCVETTRMVREVAPGLDIEIADYPWHLGSIPQKLAELVDVTKVASDLPIMDGIQALDMDFYRLKYSFCPEEIERLEWLGIETAKTIEEIAKDIKIGDSEFEVKARCSAELWKKGIRPAILYIAADERAMDFKHPLTIGKKIEKSMIFVVMTMKYGMMVALSRLVFFGDIDEEYRRKLDAAMKVDATYIGNTIPGAIASDILKKGVEVYGEAGYGEYWKDQFQGGPTGYEFRNYFTNFETQEVVALNQAFAWNPMIDGLKSEDTIITTEDGPKFVTMTGNWPTKDFEVNGRIISRCDALIK